MKISSFMDSLKCTELAKRLSDKAPRTVNEIMKRLDDFVRSERAFAQTELPKGETREQHRKLYFPPTRKDDRPLRNHQMTDQRRYNPRDNSKGRDNVVSYRGRDNRPPYPPPRGDYQARVALVLTLDALTKHLKEILATETQLHLAPPRPMINPQRGGNMESLVNEPSDKGCTSKGKRESNGRWSPAGKDNQHDRDQIPEREQEEGTRSNRKMDGCTHHFSSDLDRRGWGFSDRTTNVWRAVGGQGYSGQKNIRRRGDTVEPLGKIELEVCFGSEGLCRRITMKFTVIRALSPYNVILGRTGLRALRAIPSTIHSMMKFPTLRGIDTLVTRSAIISECRRLEKKQVVEEEKKEEVKMKAVSVTKEILVSLAFPDQLVVIGRRTAQDV
ncbi:hypothetical protein Tco_1518416 [Tanacetum coccineum]